MSWPVALRIAQREARRARGRSLLVVAMIALPVLGVTALDVLARTYTLTADQQYARSYGAATATVEDLRVRSATVNPDGSYDLTGQAARAALTPAQLAAALPVGTRVLTAHRVRNTRGGDPTLSRAGRSVAALTRQFAWSDPLARGTYRVAQGRAASAPDEVALTTALADRLHVQLGERLTLSTGVAAASRQLRVVGLVHDASRTDQTTALLAPGAVEPQTPDTVLVTSDRPFTFADVASSGRRGLLLVGRHSLTGGDGETSSGALPQRRVSQGLLLGGMALLEIVLLAGPAFAVGAKRQARELALLQATGAARRDVRRTVLASGLVLGTVGAATGLVLGLLGGRLAVPGLERFRHQVPGPWDVRPLDLMAVVGLGVLTALLAAVLPAHNASRQNVLAALTGRRGGRRSSVVPPLAGTGLTALGAVIAWRAATRQDTVLLLSGSVIAELGLVATTPALVGLAGRLGSLLPAVPRMALRDASRQRSRTAPAVAAVLAGVAGAVAIGTYVASLDGYDRDTYSPRAARDTVVLPLRDQDSSDQAAVAGRLLQQVLPTGDVQVVQTTATLGTPARGVYLSVELPLGNSCPLNTLAAPPTPQAIAEHRRDPRCTPDPTGELPTTVVGDAATVAVLTGDRSPQVAAVLARGGVVVPARYLRSDGTALLVVDRPDGSASARMTLPAVGLPTGAIGYDIVSTTTARRLGAVLSPGGLAARLSRQPSTAEVDRVNGALRLAGLQSEVYVEHGYRSSAGPVLLGLLGISSLVVLGASGIATGLAAADGKTDLATLAAVGATPGLRRALAGFQSATTAVLGTVLGAVAGFVPAIGLVHATNSARPSLRPFPVVLPWSNLLVTLLVVPLVAGLAAALLTRSRLPMVRRTA